MIERPTLGVIGMGKVGTTLARLYIERGYTIAATSSRGTSVSAHEVVRAADLTLICVPDDAIPSIVLSIVAHESNLSEKAVVHTSGAHNARIIDWLTRQGARVGSLHPAYPFADVESAVTGLIGATFAIEAVDERLKRWLSDLVSAVDGHVIWLTADQKALYHAALCIASNYTVTLYDIAHGLLQGLGATQTSVDQALSVLMAGTVHNLQTKGIPDALTGPLVRGDIQTINAHLAALEAVHTDIVYDLYRLLASMTLPMVRARGTSTEALEKLLAKDNDDAIDSTRYPKDERRSPTDSGDHGV